MSAVANVLRVFVETEAAKHDWDGRPTNAPKLVLTDVGRSVVWGVMAFAIGSGATWLALHVDAGYGISLAIAGVLAFILWLGSK